MKILLAVDGSVYTKRMLGFLTANDDWLGRDHETTVLTVVTPVPPGAAAMVEKATLADYYAEEAEKVLKPVRRHLARRKFAVDCQYKVGPAADTIASFAARGRFHLVVMGSRGRGALASLVLGSVATRVLAECSVPVLLIR
jgi:nucleotide-binding universal stress UspA family protein